MFSCFSTLWSGFVLRWRFHIGWIATPSSCRWFSSSPSDSITTSSPRGLLTWSRLKMQTSLNKISAGNLLDMGKRRQKPGGCDKAWPTLVLPCDLPTWPTMVELLVRHDKPKDVFIIKGIVYFRRSQSNLCNPLTKWWWSCWKFMTSQIFQLKVTVKNDFESILAIKKLKFSV